MSWGPVPDEVEICVARPACDATRAFCRCGLDWDHDGPHVCDRPNELGDGAPCGGSWLIEGDEIVTYAWPRTGLGLEDSAPPLPYREPRFPFAVPRGPIQFHRPPEIDA